MSLALAVASYDDFKTAVSSLPRKFTVFYHLIVGNSAPFYCWAISTDMQALIKFENGIVEPATFSTDFPDAVQFTANFPAFSSVFTKESPT
jgi:hypothetical protein